ncbi:MULTISPECIES: 3-hydroxybutyryl-CoA dehydrogenase [unclassified Rhodococcus (in: high G+C Gram-positive bacteria)]|uniref:3-hydroxybutyryl-CoA dehydrogenase n=1 Tax=unclassified Rhodococcus (in: high G+C Gram-positive bacteria) TaxID=192944 RepID=UPI001C9ADC57|nr:MULTISPECIES: 3-hydroxybutyryl-CoA dehydrogenase [unclassified Rhodococcus (in: high G+C Gram-positive bacteria)]MBY6680525.1 3-hydroxybutyryl-CoA dehydrogenase [Rhodococcus sp. BP-316]MBY6684871.1 3-hydroxybutyryl-CoA dehydrogenase [Rhodococcus sp. BP-288]MBY6692645.1 3-hydroxybutyryl-CoA dehydrogenase [Rhodococcus sp. BP-188]MBY6698543.1 3-hydroxybutyryl-CoA dehydrogenase [Rhodococcus sp. BP-285]MBY6701222.1 3-hydroxybutyryl-CoA dehydrogenase [Rhodococcus sp. BP-283]
MSSEKIERVGIVGAGQMGAGIAEVCARAHVDVIVFEQTRELAAAGKARILKSLDRGVSSGKITEREREQAAARLTFTSELSDFADREIVVEAVLEDEGIKTALFVELDRVVTDPDAVLASNTSSIPIMKLGVATTRPERVIGMHFFNPVPVLPLVELISSLKTSDAVLARAERFAADVLGKQVVRAADRSGFVVNALLVPYLLSAIRMVESGFATRDDIDKATVLGLAHPMGPLALSDLIGLDTVKSIADSMYAEYKEPLYAPPPLLLRMVEAGLLGKKTSAGFYEYVNGRIAT